MEKRVSRPWKCTFQINCGKHCYVHHNLIILITKWITNGPISHYESLKLIFCYFQSVISIWCRAAKWKWTVSKIEVIIGAYWGFGEERNLVVSGLFEHDLYSMPTFCKGNQFMSCLEDLMRSFKGDTILWCWYVIPHNRNNIFSSYTLLKLYDIEFCSFQYT